MSLADKPAPAALQPDRQMFLGSPFDLVAADAAIERLRLRPVTGDFDYVVTPNVDHVVRLAREPELLRLYQSALMCWCDSRPLRALARLRGLALPHLTGADGTARLFSEVLQPGDRVTCISADDALVGELRARFPHLRIVGHSPPPGFENHRAAFDACVDFIVQHPARFVFIGVGSPRSEKIALAVKATGRATGIGLCVGAALEFLAGRKARAPRSLQGLGLEWLHRLASEPRRLWRRYLFAVPPLAILMLRELMPRRRA